MSDDEKTIYEEAKYSLNRIQNFDVSELPRVTDLGATLNFNEIVDDAQKLIELYKRLSIIALDDFPDESLHRINDIAKQHLELFDRVLRFDPGTQDPSSARKALIDQTAAAYRPAFDTLYVYIAYSLHRAADFQRLDTEARATLGAISKQSSEVSNELFKYKEAAEDVLTEIRQIAAEQGVTKEAIHFSTEYEVHAEAASNWKKATIWLSVGLVIFAIISLFLHKIPILIPENPYDAIQLSISKFLIFSVVAYMLFLSAKNFLSHKHNAIINKHRQNALMTHSALVEASGDEGVRDVVLLQASSCIFSPQSTGYSTDAVNDSSNQKSMVEILSRPLSRAAVDASK
ncbi:hypothetical protein [Kordiimonas laminariae]|uniref:hypothetical protein n=1 Tax=Kordiimonas laminariae TaxID=2917717 RepID=UPI001FF48D3B|nr:hypothetical protein [Kordiimonas laminariae]MCK0070866.1 hypothetical protein [Kordiimonas laminariae]